MSAASGAMRGGDARSRAVRLAGALAELGAARLVCTRIDGTTLTLAARRTDLPTMLLDPEIVSLDCAELSLHIEVGPSSITWQTADPQTAEGLASLG